MLNIDFFCCNSGEVIFYLPVLRHLKNARLVVLESRYDYLRTERFLKKLGIPFQKKPSKSVSLVITTQPKSQPWTLRYWRDVPKVRVIYSLCNKGKQHERRMFAPFSLVLAPGPYSHDIASKFTKSVIVGYPKYDNFFRGLIRKDEVLAELGLDLDEKKKTILYAPTYNQYNLSSIPLFYNQVMQLTDNFNVIYKPHVYTDFNEKHFIELFKRSNVQVVSALTWFDKLLTISDLVIGDAQSGVPWEGVITNKPTLAFVRTSDIPPMLLELEIINGRVVPTVCHPDDVRETIEQMLSCPTTWEQKRLVWADKVCSHRDGTAGKRSADAIVKFAERSRKVSRSERLRKLKALQSDKRSLIYRGLRKIYRLFNI